MIDPTETPGDMAARIAGSWSVNDAGETLILAGIRADRRVITEWCEEKAAAADREAQSHDIAGEAGFGTVRERMHRCEGQAVAWRGLAAILRR